MRAGVKQSPSFIDKQMSLWCFVFLLFKYLCKAAYDCTELDFVLFVTIVPLRSNYHGWPIDKASTEQSVTQSPPPLYPTLPCSHCPALLSLPCPALTALPCSHDPALLSLPRPALTAPPCSHTHALLSRPRPALTAPPCSHDPALLSLPRPALTAPPCSHSPAFLSLVRTLSIVSW